MAEGKEDFPFSSEITKLCELTASQEAKLRNCPIARESENYTDSNPDDHFSPSQPSEIVVVSVPSSADQQPLREDAEYYTPPEHHLSSSDDQNPDVGVFEAGSGDEPVSKRARVEESDADAVALGETEGDEDEITVLGGGDCNGVEKPQIGRGKTGESSAGLKGGDPVDLGATGGEIRDSISGKSRQLLPSLKGKEKEKRKRARVSAPGEESDADAVALGETGGDEDEITVLGSRDSNGVEKPQIGRAKNGESRASLKGGDAADLGANRGEIRDSIGEKLKHSGKRIEDFRYSEGGSDHEVRKSRQLPPSLKEKEKEKEKSSRGLLDLVELLKTVFEDADADADPDDADFIAAAKKKGLVFPRPRWWPPPGEDDENYPV